MQGNVADLFPTDKNFPKTIYLCGVQGNHESLATELKKTDSKTTLLVEGITFKMPHFEALQINSLTWKFANFEQARFISCSTQIDWRPSSSKLDFDSTSFTKNCSFIDCDFDSAIFENCTFQNCVFNDSKFTSCQFTNCTFRDCSGGTSIGSAFTGCKGQVFERNFEKEKQDASDAKAKPAIEDTAGATLAQADVATTYWDSKENGKAKKIADGDLAKASEVIKNETNNARRLFSNSRWMLIGISLTMFIYILFLSIFYVFDWQIPWVASEFLNFSNLSRSQSSESRSTLAQLYSSIQSTKFGTRITVGALLFGFLILAFKNSNLRRNEYLAIYSRVETLEYSNYLLSYSLTINPKPPLETLEVKTFGKVSDALLNLSQVKDKVDEDSDDVPNLSTVFKNLMIAITKLSNSKT